MKLARFAVDGNIQRGRVREDGHLVTSAGKDYSPEQVVWLPPVNPTKVIGLALNFAEHAAELDMESPLEPALFFKPISSLVGHRAPIIYPTGIEYMHYEVELAVVIGRRCRNVPAGRAEDVIAGYTIANDVTVRDFVRDFYRPPVRAKGYDTLGPVGPYIVSPDEIPDPGNLELRAYVNGELRQQGNSSQLIRSVPELIEFISMIMILEAGDMIWTGILKGISHIYPGDQIRLEIDDLAALMANTIGIEIFQHIQEKMAEIWVTLETMKAFLLSAEVNAESDEYGVMRPAWDPLDAARNLYPHLYPKMISYIQQLGASGLVAAPTEADVNGPLAEEIKCFYQAARADAHERIPIFRLAWDTALSAFAARQVLYERYFFGDPVRMAGALVRSHDFTPHMDMIREFLARADEEAHTQADE